MKKILKIILSIFLVFILTSGGGLFYLSRGLDEGVNVPIKGVNLLDIKDGIYTGKYEAGRWTNEVHVTIKEHQITDINVVKDVRFVKPEVTKALLGQVMEQQKTDIEAVSGATVTSKAYLKAIENALSK